MTVVLTRRNLSELSRLVELASDLCMEQVFVQRLCHSFQEAALPAHYRPMRDYVEREDLSGVAQGEVSERFDQARALAARLGVEVRLPQVSQRGAAGRQGTCDWPATGIYVSYQGCVMPCCMVATPDRVNFGKTRGDDIMDIWNGRAFTSFRNRLASGNPPDICRSCAVFLGTF
jgi:radical SAM protein with 4Fe4S-binding SPASM domain